MNYSATRSDFKVMKTVTTEIHFFIKNTDREPVVLGEGESLAIVITDQKRTRDVLTKTLELVDPSRSIWKLALSKDEVADWPLATLSYSILVNRSTGDQVMLYLDRGYGGYSELRVLAGPHPDPRQPEEFDVSEFISRTDTLYSTAIPASIDLDFPQTAFTFAFYASGFKGRLSIQATLDEQPETDENMWFDAAEIDVKEETNGPIGLNAIGSFSFIRVLVRTDEGEITRVVLQR